MFADGDRVVEDQEFDEYVITIKIDKSSPYFGFEDHFEDLYGLMESFMTVTEILVGEGYVYADME